MTLPIQKKQKILLLVCATGLIPIALSYGLMPEKSLEFLYGISADNTNLIHIMRAIMGLYFGQIIFWYMGASNPDLRRTAVYVLIIFMWGLVLGRIFSLLVDGVPHWLLWTYGVIEFAIGLLGLQLIKKEKQ